MPGITISEIIEPKTYLVVLNFVALRNKDKSGRENQNDVLIINILISLLSLLTEIKHKYTHKDLCLKLLNAIPILYF